ncbi:Bug family tripartite tricarboxylate transporter substrate binding protein [Pelagibacterium montanilacus]|uniref:Bug family tripartite tricarboxylate transporter substrate binding protein n=1 Tax=Pelagibacterium montanilacus TaxID=2185280 RepID=UPI0013E0480C|nr:tripartite tricarboxylate transporter substrate-binding protein [Pelagibacterium montanilacus]
MRNFNSPMGALAGAAMVIAGLSVAAPVHAQDAPYYEGKTLNLLVPFGPGGGTDVWARYLAEYLPEAIEGSPTVLVENRPGGGSITGVNHFAMQVEPDGETVLITSGSSIQPYLLEDPAVRYDLADWRPVAANPVGAIFYVHPSTGIESADDLGSASEELYYGGISATGNDLVMLLIFDLLDMNVQSIMGYDGKGPIRVAYERGEVNTDYQVTPAYTTSVEPLVAADQAVPIFTFGIIDANGDVVADEAFPDLPTVKDVYISIHGEEPSGQAWEAYKTFLAAGFGVQKIMWVKNDTPEQAVAALEEAIRQIAEDPEAIERGVEVLGGYPLLYGEDAAAAARSIVNADPEAAAYAMSFLEELGLR